MMMSSWFALSSLGTSSVIKEEYHEGNGTCGMAADVYNEEHKVLARPEDCQRVEGLSR